MVFKLQKRTLLSIALLGCSELFGQNPIPNPYFEAWDARTIENPVFWKCTGLFSRQTGQGQSAALRLSNNSAQQIASYAEQVRFNDNPGYSPSFPINGTPDSIRITYRSMLDQDTASVLLGFYNSGDSIPVIFEEIAVFGNTTGFITKSFPLTYIHPDMNIEADSGWISIVSADIIDGPLSNGYIDLLNIEFIKAGNSMQGLPNGNFTDWTSYTFDFPLGWTTSLAMAAESGVSMNHSARSSETRSGATALKLNAYTVNDGSITDTIPGFAMTVQSSAITDLMSPYLEAPSFSLGNFDKPLSVYGFVKSNLLSGDILRIYVNLFDDDTIVASSITTLTQSFSVYTEFADDLAYLPNYNGTPDKATIGIIVSDSSENKVNHLQSYALIEDLRFESWNVRTKGLNLKGNLRVFPNPGKDLFHIQGHFNTGDEFNILTSDGRKVNTIKATESGTLTVTLGQFQPGFYLIQHVQSNQQIKILLQP